jgi:hypothetical protein
MGAENHKKEGILTNGGEEAATLNLDLRKSGKEF